MWFPSIPVHVCVFMCCYFSVGFLIYNWMNYNFMLFSFSCPVIVLQSKSAMRMPKCTRQTRQYNYECSRAQIAARSQAEQCFTELARMRNNPQNPVLAEKDTIEKVGSRLIVLMDYPASQDDELSLQFGEAVFSDVLNQADMDRIWAYCPRSDKCGFVPTFLLVLPVV